MGANYVIQFISITQMRERKFFCFLVVRNMIIIIGMQKIFRVVYIMLMCQAFISFSLLAQKKDFVLVEAESFNEKGGWVLDQQFMDQMGSPFLLAHGIGKPVQDASTGNDSKKRNLAYMRMLWNWCSPWKTKESPGRFKIAVNGAVLDNELGMGTQWNWEYAGISR